MADEGKPTKAELLRGVSERPTELGRQSAVVELYAFLADEAVAVIDQLSSEVGRFRGAVTRLGEDSAATSRVLTWWTGALALATIVLAGATVALVWATLQLAKHP